MSELVIIIGANAGIGLATAQQDILLVGRRLQLLQEAIEAIMPSRLALLCS